jgi:hypothetical protein
MTDTTTPPPLPKKRRIVIPIVAGVCAVFGLGAIIYGGNTEGSAPHLDPKSTEKADYLLERGCTGPDCPSVNEKGEKLNPQVKVGEEVIQREKTFACADEDHYLELSSAIDDTIERAGPNVPSARFGFLWDTMNYRLGCPYLETGQHVVGFDSDQVTVRGMRPRTYVLWCVRPVGVTYRFNTGRGGNEVQCLWTMAGVVTKLPKGAVTK